MGIIPVNRKIKNPEAVKIAVARLKLNQVIGIFPEGTINKTKDIIMPFKMGAVKIAKESDAYIVPFAIKGKYKVFGKSLSISFAKPYKIKSEDLVLENKKLEKKVITLLERI